MISLYCLLFAFAFLIIGFWLFNLPAAKRRRCNSNVSFFKPSAVFSCGIDPVHLNQFRIMPMKFFIIFNLANQIPCFMVSIPTEAVNPGKASVQTNSKLGAKFNLSFRLTSGYGPYVRLEDAYNPIRTAVGFCIEHLFLLVIDSINDPKHVPLGRSYGEWPFLLLKTI